MAKYRIHDPNEKLLCPYDDTHKIEAKRFQYHLMDCRKNHSGKAFVTCPFNAKHELPKPKLRYHLTVCPDRIIIEQELDYAARKASGEDTRLKGYTATPVYRDFETPSSEDWDAELAPRGSVGPKQDSTSNSLAVFKDWSRSHVNGTVGASPNLDREEDLRLPMSTSIAALQPKPIDQPLSSVFAYSIGRGSGQPRQVGAPETFTPGYGRASALGIGRGLAPGMGRGNVAPPPGFSVPNVNQKIQN